MMLPLKRMCRRLDRILHLNASLARQAIRRVLPSLFLVGKYRYLPKHREMLRRLDRRSAFALRLDYIASALWFGCTPEEYIGYGFYRLNRRAKAEYILQRNMSRVYRPFWSAHEKPLFRNKDAFGRMFGDFIKREWIYCPNHDAEQIGGFISRHPRFIAKPPSLRGGMGIERIDSAEVPDLDARIEEYRAKGFVLEEVLVQHEALARLNPTSVNTVRAVCLKDRSGAIHIVAAALRVGGEGSIVDNVDAGGRAFPIDVDSGRVTQAGIDKLGDRHLYARGTFMPGFQIPHWDALRAFVADAMRVVPQMRMVGWDACILPDGVEMVEGNTHPATLSVQIDLKGRKHLFKTLA